MKKLFIAFILSGSICSSFADAVKEVDHINRSFPLVTETQITPILVDRSDAKVVKISSELLAKDINAITGRQPDVIFSENDTLSETVIIAGTIGNSAVIDNLIKTKRLDVSPISHKWEASMIVTLTNVSEKIKKAVIVVGSDRRGTAYGLMDISRSIGISPWIWWADVLPEHKSKLYLSSEKRIETGPSVKYRGIFINDEDWGLQPWAAKTFEPETGDIGPKTYTKVFELMLRLKANILWPAMHESTKAFNSFPENARIADDYAIVMGSSHAEPMLRNNVGEWKAPHDQYNYVTNRDDVLRYWDQRLVTNGKFENVYTIGMRGIHDSHMEGLNTDEERVKMLGKVFADQRALITKHTGLGADQVPQMFCAYKEVLGLYRQGLSVPDDVTIVWPDDNFGYVRNYANKDERKRKGGFGVYYHLSYLGYPLNYLWLNTVPPALIFEEMHKSYEYGARNIWIANVGDIKPGEIGADLFLQMAWDIKRWNVNNIKDFLPEFASREFGSELGPKIGTLMTDYYRLNYQRKPEHLQWWLPKSHGTPERTPARASTFNADEIRGRLAEFKALAARTEDIRKKLNADKQDAFFQLISYPIDSSALANIRFFEGEAGNTEVAIQADKQLATLTKRWDSDVANGKWRGIMGVEPANDLWHEYRIDKWDAALSAKLAEEYPKQPLRKTNSIAIEAEIFSRKRENTDTYWQVIPGLGRTGEGSVSLVYKTPPSVLPSQIDLNGARLEYDLNFPEAGEFELVGYLVPTHPIMGTQLRFGFAIDKAQPQLAVLETNDGKPDWAQGVLNNTRTLKVKINVLTKGKHKLHIYGVDPGVIFDKFVIDIDGVQESYLGLPATRQ